MTVIRHCLLAVLGLGLMLGLVACGTTGSAGSVASDGGAPASALLQGASPSPSGTASSPPRHAPPNPQHRRSAATPPSSSRSPRAGAAGGCYPLSDEDTCYQPGEYCRDDDHGVTGRTASGESIICADNDGWRWEPAGGSTPRPTPPPTSPPATGSPSPSASPTSMLSGT